MKNFPNDITFKYPWRKYQQRVLDDLQNHLKNNHLHVIAPPGSGKTVLGLEVAIRLNQATLILAPTLAIRNQWIQRFCELFLQTHQIPDWISRDIRNPKFLTVITYQGLHAACNNLKTTEEIEELDDDMNDENLEQEESVNAKASNPNLNQILDGLKNQNVKTIVVDEAHHLKNEWWHTLTKVKHALNPVVVGLTATPPYDVTPHEWQRYVELNGPVDTEITVPELIQEGDLCPHQDYVYFTTPTKQENQRIIEFRKLVEQLFREIKTDQTLLEAIEQHPMVITPLEHLEWIYNNLGYYSACLIFLNANQKTIPTVHFDVIGEQHFEIPTLNLEWLETLLDFYIFKEKEHFQTFEEHRKFLENKLKRNGIIERRRISFSNNKNVSGFLSSSISKLSGIQKIVDFEYNNLKNNLRLVILSDFIRKEYLSNSSINDMELNKIGVIPIFEKLRRENSNNKRIGVLTGSLVIIPKSAFAAFENHAEQYGITKINCAEIPYDDNYLLISQHEQLKHAVVQIVTHIFQKGEIEVLIGTKSLLGEGWDAPAINTLILASFVGSFVLSNQMRGRAIRTQNGNTDKTGNIWHVVCLDPTSKSGGDDYELLTRRFRSFVGVSFREEIGIENGIGRLDLPEDIQLESSATKKNEEMFASAANREALKSLWKEAVDSGVNLVEEIKIPFEEEKTYRSIKTLYWDKTISRLLAALTSGLAIFAEIVLQILGKSLRHFHSIENFYVFLLVACGIGVLIFGNSAYKSFSMYLKYRDISKDIQQIGEALLNALIRADIIRYGTSKPIVASTVDESGAVFCHLEGGTTYDKSTFILALKEVISPIENPKYVIIRKSTMLFIKQRDYHAVPESLGRKKNLAEFFHKQWLQHVGDSELIFTRTIEGRKLLLKSRVKALSTQFQPVEQVNKWR